MLASNEHLNDFNGASPASPASTNGRPPGRPRKLIVRSNATIELLRADFGHSLAGILQGSFRQTAEREQRDMQSISRSQLSPNPVRTLQYCRDPIDFCRSIGIRKDSKE